MDRKTHIENLYICQEIGNIAEANCHYSDGISRRIASTGKHIMEMTVKELLTLHREYRAVYNKVHDDKPKTGENA